MGVICLLLTYGALLATASGDGSLKVWDFFKATCKSIFTEHGEATW